MPEWPVVLGGGRIVVADLHPLVGDIPRSPGIGIVGENLKLIIDFVSDRTWCCQHQRDQGERVAENNFSKKPRALPPTYH
jgi:hypothetical protein